MRAGARLGIRRGRIDEIALAAPGVDGARGAIGARPGLLLTLEDEAGERGQGEASPLPGWSRESIEQCRRALEAVRWKETAVELDGDPLAAIARVVRGLDAGAPSARFAAETALLDLAGKRLSQPAYALLARRADVEPVALAALLAGAGEAELVVQAHAAIGRGVRTIKWKIGRPGGFERELAALAALRRAVGYGVAIRLDANGGFALEDAPARLRALAAIGPELVEEPVADLWRLPSPLPCPIAADELLHRDGGVALVERAIASGACAAVVLKPTLLGGALACLDIACRARALGAGAFVTHAFEGPVALAASAALALALPGRQYASGLDRHGGLSAWSTVELPMIAGDRIVPAGGPGLGLSPVGGP